MLVQMVSRILLLPFALFLAYSVPASASVPIYENGLDSAATRGQVVKYDGQNCQRGGSRVALRIQVGARTRACSFTPPVVGRDLDIGVTARLLSGTPKRLRARAYLAVGLRAGDGGVIKARVFPVQRKMQLIAESPEGDTKFLEIAKDAAAIRGINKANRIYLRAFTQGEPGNCRVVVRVNGRRLAVSDLSHCARLTGRDSTFEAGSVRGANGLTASFAKLRMSVPDPFAG